MEQYGNDRVEFSNSEMEECGGNLGIYAQISRLGDDIQEKLIRLRRDFHRHPEVGWMEMRTSAIIAEELTRLGFEVLTGKAVCMEGSRLSVPDKSMLEEHYRRVKAEASVESKRGEEEGETSGYMDFLSREMTEGFTGVVGILRCGDGPVVALRFDIDALPIKEDDTKSHRPAREGFASVYQGMMHACGHDCHAAIGLGTAQIISLVRDKLRGTVKLLFQPGEEGVKGAGAMVAAGHLDGVDYFAGTHVAPYTEEDDGDLTPGTYGSLATSKYNVYFHGQSCHAGGFPEEGRNAVLAAAHATVGLYGIARHSEGITRVNVGSIWGGASSNVVADKAVLSMEVRGETAQIHEFMDRRAKEVCQAAALMEGCTCEMELTGQAPSQISDLPFIERIAGMVRDYLPQYEVSGRINAKNWGSEDIGFMMKRVQAQGGLAVYMRTMTVMASPQHTSLFDVDESVLKKGAVIFASIVFNLIGNSETAVIEKANTKVKAVENASEMIHKLE